MPHCILNIDFYLQRLYFLSICTDYVNNYWTSVDKINTKRTYDLFLDVFQHFDVYLLVHRGMQKFEDAVIITFATSHSQGGLFSRTLRNY